MSLRRLLHPIDGCPVVAGSLVVGAGWRHEPLGLEGLAHLAEHAHFLGSERFADVDAALAPYGCHIDGATYAEKTTFDFVCLRDDAPAVLDVLQDAVYRPTFDSERSAAEREIVRSAMAEASDFTPWEWARLKLDDLLFEVEELASLGTLDSFARITRRHVADWQRRYYHAGASTLCLAGDPDALARLHPGASIQAVGQAATLVRRGSGRRAYHRPDEGQRPELYLGFRFPLSAYSPAVELLRILVGNYPSSRLWQRMRTQAPLAYVVGGELRLQSDGGRLALYVGCGDVASPHDVWQALVALIDDLRASPPSPDELRWAQKTAQLELRRFMLDPEQALRYLLSRWPCLDPAQIDDAEPFAPLLAGLEAQSADDVARAASEILRGGAAGLSVVGDTVGWSVDDALGQLQTR